MSVRTSKGREAHHGVASTATAVGVGGGVPVDTDPAGILAVPAQGGEAPRPEGQDGQAELAKIVAEMGVVRVRGGDVDALCRLKGRLQALFKQVDDAAYWHADQQLTDLIKAAGKPQGIAETGDLAIAAVDGATPDGEHLPHSGIAAPGRAAAQPTATRTRTMSDKAFRHDRGGVPCDAYPGQDRADGELRAASRKPARPESEPAPTSARVTAQAHPAAADPPGASVPTTDDVQEIVGELEFHPTADFLPLMSDAEFESLVASIAAHGQREPVVLYRNRIVDGRHRYRACRQLGLSVKVKPWDERGSLVAFIIDRNLERRHLSESQRALLAVQLKGAFEEEARANMSRGGQGLADLPTLHSRDQAAAAVKVSSRLVGSAAKVVKQGAPALVAAVGRDEVTVSAAADVVALDPDEQAALVAQGPAAVREKARELREAKPKKKATRSEDTSRRPDDAESGDRVKNGEENLLPPSGWLEQHPVRSRLADPAAFDCLATLWWVAQQVLARFGLCPGEKVRRARALLALFEPDLLDLAILTEDPGRWAVCVFCQGAGREDDERCSSCHGRGFRAVQLEPPVHRVGQSSPAPGHAEERQPKGTAKGGDQRGVARSTTVCCAVGGRENRVSPGILTFEGPGLHYKT